MYRILLLYLPFLWGAQLYAQQQEGAKAVRDTYNIYVVSISWHTGILVPARQLPDSIWPQGYEYTNGNYLEIGWGDRDFYQHRGFHLWYAIKAVLWPTPSVLHVNPVPERIEAYYRDTRVVEISVKQEQLNQIIGFILEEFEYNEKGKLIPLQDGIYPDSQFFAGSSSYYFPKNSNVWIARSLKQAGFPITPVWYQTTGCLLNKVENFGRLVVE